MKKYKEYMNGVKAPDTLHQRLVELKKRKKSPAPWAKYGSIAAALVLVFGGLSVGIHRYVRLSGYLDRLFHEEAYFWESQSASKPDIAVVDPGEMDEPGAKTIGGYDMIAGSGPEAMVTHYILPYIEYGDTGGVEMCVDWDIPAGVSRKDLSREEIVALLGGDEAMSVHLDWSTYELTGWGAWYEDGAFWGAYIYGYEGPLDHFEFAVTAGRLPPTCIAFPESVTQEIRGLTVTASGYDSVATPQGGVDASARRVDFMRDGYGYGFDITGTSRTLTDERASRLVCCVIDERLALWTVDPNVETYICADCGQTVPTGRKHSHPSIGVGGDSSASAPPVSVSDSPRDRGEDWCGTPSADPYMCTGYPVPEQNGVSQEAGCGMPDMDKPPRLNVVCGSASLNGGSGNYEWKVDLGNGQTSSVIACGAHPLEFRDAPSMTTEAGKAKLNFAGTPDRVRADCWPDSEWGNTAAGRQTADVEKSELTLGFELSLKEGGWIYELTAEWDGYGTASYVFYITKT